MNHQPFTPLALKRRVTTLAVTLLVIAATVSTAGASAETAGTAGGHPIPEAQAKSLGLTAKQAEALRSEVTSRLAESGGTQTGVNKIRLDSGAVMLLAVPGEERARDLDSEAGKRGAAYVCSYGHMCAYSGVNFTGSVIDMYRCQDYPISWVGRGSWDNNQISGTRAKFKDANGAVGWTSPGAHSTDANADWTWVYWVRNC
ncbi:peptidase inhibitor family I36 protein [Streptomyces sp. NPDC012623]|uniref:peptidase inhibitor family I36 protein n=1 Tax=unclassified Streptomyces TaxID=2593676 RepID=UPI00369007EA